MLNTKEPFPFRNPRAYSQGDWILQIFGSAWIGKVIEIREEGLICNWMESLFHINAVIEEDNLTGPMEETWRTLVDSLSDPSLIPEEEKIRFYTAILE